MRSLATVMVALGAASAGAGYAVGASGGDAAQGGAPAPGIRPLALEATATIATLDDAPGIPVLRRDRPARTAAAAVPVARAPRPAAAQPTAPAQTAPRQRAPRRVTPRPPVREGPEIIE